MRGFIDETAAADTDRRLPFWRPHLLDAARVNSRPSKTPGDEAGQKRERGRAYGEGKSIHDLFSEVSMQLHLLYQATEVLQHVLCPLSGGTFDSNGLPGGKLLVRLGHVRLEQFGFVDWTCVVECAPSSLQGAGPRLAGRLPPTRSRTRGSRA